MMDSNDNSHLSEPGLSNDDNLLYRIRNVLGIRIKHMNISRSFLYEQHMCNIETNNTEFVLDHINDIFQSAFESNHKYTLKVIHYYSNQWEFIIGVVHCTNDKDYILRGTCDGKNGIRLIYNMIK